MKRIAITLAQIQTYIAVVETGSFTAASEQLGMTQSAVSHSVSALEKVLQVSLLERSRSGIAVTEVGQSVLIQARAMLSCAERIQQTAAAAVGLETGSVRVGSFPSVSARFLPGLLRQFKQRCPGIKVTLFEGTDDEVREWIKTRVVDVGAITLPAEAFETVAIGQDEFLAVVSCNHPLANQTKIDVRQLANEPFIMSKAGCRPTILAMFSQVKTMPNVQFETVDLRTIFAMVREGIGVTIVPAMALPDDCSGLRATPLNPARHRQLAFAVLSLETATPAAAAFLKEITVRAQSLGTHESGAHKPG